MTEPKKFTRGKHTYTRYGGKFKEVRVEGKPVENAASNAPTRNITIQGPSDIETGVYSNMTMVHQTQTETIVDFIYMPPSTNKALLRSRVILPLQQVKLLAAALNKAVSDLEKFEKKTG